MRTQKILFSRDTMTGGMTYKQTEQHEDRQFRKAVNGRLFHVMSSSLTFPILSF